MTPNLDWLSRLRRDNKGIWGIECPLGTTFDVQNLNNLSPNCETEVIHVEKDGGIMRFRDSSKCLMEPDFSKILERMSKAAAENGWQSIRIVIGDFQNADAKEQCALIKTARSIQESITSLSCQFVFCGKWSYFAFSSAYRELHGRTSSPPAESKNILQVPSWSAKESLELLIERRLMAATPSEIDLVACDFLVEQTAGDEFLIRQAVEHLIEQEGKWPSDIEQVLIELVSAPDIVDAITQRFNSLEVHLKAELSKLIRVHRLIRPYDEPVSEQLWLAGLVQRRKLDSGKQCIQIAGPLINTVVSHILESENPGSVAPPNDLCFAREAISTAAYSRIAQIENMLRNLIVSEWYAALGDKWSDNLMGTKTSARNWEEQEDLIKLVMLHVQSGLGIDTKSSRTEPTTTVVSSERPHQITIFDSAKDWQRRQRDNHAIELSNDNLMHFLTTESLISVLVNKKNGLYGEGKPFKKEDLQAVLGEYIAIRSAVAHNQPIKLSTILRLDEMQRKFIDWLTVFADKLPARD